MGNKRKMSKKIGNNKKLDIERPVYEIPKSNPYKVLNDVLEESTKIKKTREEPDFEPDKFQVREIHFDDINPTKFDFREHVFDEDDDIKQTKFDVKFSDLKDEFDGIGLGKKIPKQKVDMGDIKLVTGIQKLSDIPDRELGLFDNRLEKEIEEELSHHFDEYYKAYKSRMDELNKPASSKALIEPIFKAKKLRGIAKEVYDKGKKDPYLYVRELDKKIDKIVNPVKPPPTDLRQRVKIASPSDLMATKSSLRKTTTKKPVKIASLSDLRAIKSSLRNTRTNLDDTKDRIKRLLSTSSAPPSPTKPPSPKPAADLPPLIIPDTPPLPEAGLKSDPSMESTEEKTQEIYDDLLRRFERLKTDPPGTAIDLPPNLPLLKEEELEEVKKIDTKQWRSKRSNYFNRLMKGNQSSTSYKKLEEYRYTIQSDVLIDLLQGQAYNLPKHIDVDTTKRATHTIKPILKNINTVINAIAKTKETKPAEK